MVTELAQWRHLLPLMRTLCVLRPPDDEGESRQKSRYKGRQRRREWQTSSHQWWLESWCVPFSLRPLVVCSMLCMWRLGYGALEFEVLRGGSCLHVAMYAAFSVVFLSAVWQMTLCSNATPEPGRPLAAEEVIQFGCK